MEEGSKSMTDGGRTVQPEWSEKNDVDTILTYVIGIAVLVLFCFTVGIGYSLVLGYGGTAEKLASGYSYEPVTDHDYSAGRKRTSAAPAANPSRRNYTLVCVFQYPRKRVWPADIQCTDYVFIRLFSFTQGANIREFEFQSDVTILFRDKDEFQRALVLEKDIHENFHRIYKKYRNATWYIGMWGAMYTQMRTTAPFSVFRDSLRKHLDGGLERHGWRKSNFHGLGIVHTVPPHDVHAQILEEDTPPFPGNLKRDILPPNWKLLHTIAPTWNDPLAWKPFMYHNLKDADIAGISTSNAMFVPEWVARQVTQMWRFSAPNPTFDLNSETFMFNVLKKFADFEIELNRTDLCISITTAVNYGAFSLDAGTKMRTPAQTELLRYSQSQFVKINATTLFRKDFTNGRFTAYYNETAVFLQENTVQVRDKLEALLSRYSTGKCVVFDDIGEDGDDRVNAPYSYLREVSKVMEAKFGRAFP